MSRKIVAVIVTFNPELRPLRDLLVSLADQVDEVVVADNGSRNQSAVAELADEFECRSLLLPENLGIAAAQNRGIAYAKRLHATHVLLSDQDSVADQDMVAQLWHCLTEDGAGIPVAAVGPVPLDPRGQAGQELVYSFTRWGPKRRKIPTPGTCMEVPFVLASGCLIPVDVLDRVGPMNESLFIDHVDLAWCMRAGELGYRVLACGSAVLHHSLGDDIARVPGRQAAVHVHSPIRNYYMMRNTLFLQRATFLPTAWKLGYLWWMIKYIGYYLLLAPQRPRRARMFLRAVADGVTGKGGPLQRGR